MDILKWVASFLPRDPSDTGGYGPFRLPARADWMNAVFVYHDHYSDEGPKQNPPMRLSDIDWRIFKALTILAESPEDPMERCHRAADICEFWPIMREAGHYLYNRKAY